MKVQLEMDKRSVEKLDEIRDRISAPSRADVVRHALGLYQWVLSRVNDGARVIVEQDGERYVVTFANLTTD